MRNVLRPGAQRRLFDFLETDPLLVFDYDGTLCPIVAHAAQAVIRKPTRLLLKELCAELPCVLLSGRARADVAARARGIPFAQVVGSHGADWARPRPGDDLRRRQVDDWYQELRLRLGGLPGVTMENKGLSLSIHYRHAPSRKAAIERITRELGQLRGLRVIGGKAVFNLLPEDCGGKGWAMLELKKYYGKPTALYVGDDMTDEEVFRLPARERVFKMRVGYDRQSRADYFIAAQKDIDRLLRLLLDHGRLTKEAA